MAKIVLRNTKIASKWTPNNIIDSLVFWYDPSDSGTITTSGSTVTQVADKSGNGNTLSVTTAGKSGPTIGTRKLNGLNVFEYALTDPNNQVLENNEFSYDHSLTPLNLIMIVKCDTDALNDQDFLFSGTESATTRVALRRTTTNQIQILSTPNSIETAVGIGVEGSDLIVAARFNGANSLIRIDGTQKSGGNIGAVPLSSINIGASETEAQSIEGYIAEVVAFDDNTQTQIVEGYLAHKWGLASSLPIDHPYKNENSILRTPKCIFNGGSPLWSFPTPAQGTIINNFRVVYTGDPVTINWGDGQRQVLTSAVNYSHNY